MNPSWRAFAVVIQSLSHVQLSATPWTAAHQSSLSFTISWSLLKFMSIESVMQSNHPTVAPFFSCYQPFPASGSFPVSKLFSSGGQSIGTSSSASAFARNIQDWWFPLGLTGLISLLTKGLLRVISSTKLTKQWFVYMLSSLSLFQHIYNCWCAS